MSKIRWPIIWILALSGFVYAALTIFAIISSYEGLVILIAIAGTAKVVAYFAPEAPLRNGSVAGFFAALAAIWTQAMFLELYFENNPTYRDIGIPFGLDAQFATFVLGPINAVIYAVLVAIAAWIFARIFKRLNLSSRNGD